MHSQSEALEVRTSAYEFGWVGGGHKFSSYLGTEIDVLNILLTEFGDFPAVNLTEDCSTPASPHFTHHLHIFIAAEIDSLLFIWLLCF